jgi:quercetin dioxygenase-like cupin family protein
MLPFKQEKLNNNTFIRTFSKDVLSEELVWHRDRENRSVEVLEGEGWEIQLEDRLPKKLEVGQTYIIPAYTFHRVKRGTSDLVLKIEELL